VALFLCFTSSAYYKKAIPDNNNKLPD